MTLTDHAPEIVLDGLTKRFGSTVAVNDVSATARPGRLTAFLGPNGAGKTTTLRMLLGLVTPTSGSATIGGIGYADLVRPSTVVGALLEATGFHPGRSALDHLRVMGLPAGIGSRRCLEVLSLVRLSEAANQKVGSFSLGMRQRLGLAFALLGDPPVLVLDEPANGLDPAGIRWLRTLLRDLADEGRTLLVSSHALPEIEQIADDVLILARGRLVRQSTMTDLWGGEEARTLVETPTRGRLRLALDEAGIGYDAGADDDLRVYAGRERVGQVAATAGVVLHRLTERPDALEDLFLTIVTSATEEMAP